MPNGDIPIEVLMAQRIAFVKCSTVGNSRSSKNKQIVRHSLPASIVG